MTILKDILDFLKEIKDSDFYKAGGQINKAINKKNSLSRFSKNSILQFPVLTSNSVSIEDLTMVNKALERQYSTFVITAMNLDNVEFVKSGSKHAKADYVKRFHNNDILSAVTSGINESVHSEGILQENKKLLKPYIEDLRMNTLNDLTRYKCFKEDLEVSGTGTPLALLATSKNGVTRIMPNIKHSRTLISTPQLVDNDVKKSNELVPTLIKVPVHFVPEAGGEVLLSELIIGIKTISHLISTEEMTYNISKAIQEKRSLFRTIQWVSGEIKFFKDFLFCLDRIKKEATNTKTNSKWWRVLKHRSKVSKIGSISNIKKNLLPNTTIVITMEEAEYMLNNYGIDLINNMKSIKTLIDTFFLLGFVIIDSSAELAYFTFDGDNTFQTFSFRSLERENSNSKRDMKEIMSLINYR